MDEADKGRLMTTIGVVGGCFFWYRLTRVVPHKIQSAVKWLFVCVCVCECVCLVLSLSLCLLSLWCDCIKAVICIVNVKEAEVVVAVAVEVVCQSVAMVVCLAAMAAVEVMEVDMEQVPEDIVSTLLLQLAQQDDCRV